MLPLDLDKGQLKARIFRNAAEEVVQQEFEGILRRAHSFRADRCDWLRIYVTGRIRRI